MRRTALALAALFLCITAAPANAQYPPPDARSPMPCGPQTSGLGEIRGNCIVLKVINPEFRVGQLTLATPTARLTTIQGLASVKP